MAHASDVDGAEEVGHFVGGFDDDFGDGDAAQVVAGVVGVANLVFAEFEGWDAALEGLDDEVAGGHFKFLRNEGWVCGERVVRVAAYFGADEADDVFDDVVERVDVLSEGGELDRRQVVADGFSGDRSPVFHIYFCLHS